MRRFLAVTIIMMVAMLTTTSCNGFHDVLDDSAQLRSRAEAAGEATIYIYFSINKAEIANASELQATVRALRDVLDVFPAEGFGSLYPVINQQLGTVLKDDKLAYLPAAQRLAKVLLEELDRKAIQDSWREEAETITAAIVAFLDGAEKALSNYVPIALNPNPGHFRRLVLKLPSCACHSCRGLTVASSDTAGRIFSNYARQSFAPSHRDFWRAVLKLPRRDSTTAA